jgi:hypothetical protein
VAYDRWGISFVGGDDKEREFVLTWRDSSSAPGARGWQWTSQPMSEESLRQELADVPKEKVDAEVTKARNG